MHVYDLIFFQFICSICGHIKAFVVLPRKKEIKHTVIGALYIIEDTLLNVYEICAHINRL